MTSPALRDHWCSPAAAGRLRRGRLLLLLATGAVTLSACGGPATRSSAAAFLTGTSTATTGTTTATTSVGTTSTGTAPPVPRPPAESAAAGSVVDGVPTVVPIPSPCVITASAVQPQGDRLAVSVTGTTRLSVAQLLSFFRTRLARSGFTATGGSLLPPGASGAAFGRAAGRDLLLVAVVDRGSTRSWSIGGTLAP